MAKRKYIDLLADLEPAPPIDLLQAPPADPTEFANMRGGDPRSNFDSTSTPGKYRSGSYGSEKMKKTKGEPVSLGEAASMTGEVFAPIIEHYGAAGLQALKNSAPSFVPGPHDDLGVGSPPNPLGIGTHTGDDVPKITLEDIKKLANIPDTRQNIQNAGYDDTPLGANLHGLMGANEGRGFNYSDPSGLMGEGEWTIDQAPIAAGTDGQPIVNTNQQQQQPAPPTEPTPPPQTPAEREASELDNSHAQTRQMLQQMANPYATDTPEYDKGAPWRQVALAIAGADPNSSIMQMITKGIGGYVQGDINETQRIADASRQQKLDDFDTQKSLMELGFSQQEIDLKRQQLAQKAYHDDATLAFDREQAGNQFQLPFALSGLGEDTNIQGLMENRIGKIDTLGDTTDYRLASGSGLGSVLTRALGGGSDWIFGFTSDRNKARQALRDRGILWSYGLAGVMDGGRLSNQDIEKYSTIVPEVGNSDEKNVSILNDRINDVYRNLPAMYQRQAVAAQMGNMDEYYKVSDRINNAEHAAAEMMRARSAYKGKAGVSPEGQDAIDASGL